MPATFYKNSADPRLKFHKVGCRFLNPDAVATLLDEVHRPQACRECFPDAPRAESAHRYCPNCNINGSAQPCAHNGGVLVTMTRTRRKPSLTMAAGEAYLRQEYVWPEFARHYA